jgi:methylglutaconyl-CoA hydratase
MTMEFETIHLSVADRVATVTLSRPDVRNAISETMIAELTQAFLALGANDAVKVVVLAAAGKAFCAGADLNWMKRMSGYSDAENKADATKLARMLKTIHDCPKPVVARVQGDVYAGGTGLVGAADIAVAATEAVFCLSETRLGLIPATISPYVIRAMGERAARRYMVTAERFDAAEAWRIGFVHEVVDAAALDDAVRRYVDVLLANSSNAMNETKRLIRDVATAPLDEALLDLTATRIAQIRASDEGKEGIRSFLEKRKPSWVAT